MANLMNCRPYLFVQTPVNLTGCTMAHSFVNHQSHTTDPHKSETRRTILLQSKMAVGCTGTFWGWEGV